MRNSVISTALLLPAVVLLGGCLISSNPFYDARSIVQDDRIVGLYSDEESPSGWEVAKGASTGKYRLLLHERGTLSEYAGTLFKVGKSTFLDVCAVKPADLPRDPGGPPTSGQLLQEFTTNQRHVAFRIEIRDDELTVLAALPNNCGPMLEKEPQLKRTIEKESFLILQEPTQILQRLLAKYGQDQSLFSEQCVISKKKHS